MNEYKALSKETWTNISLINDNIFEWSVALIVLNPDSLYYGGYFKAKMTFPRNYPYEPPDFKFDRPLWHPNVYEVCLRCRALSSSLHRFEAAN